MLMGELLRGCLTARRQPRRALLYALVIVFEGLLQVEKHQCFQKWKCRNIAQVFLSYIGTECLSVSAVDKLFIARYFRMGFCF